MAYTVISDRDIWRKTSEILYFTSTPVLWLQEVPYEIWFQITKIHATYRWNLDDPIKPRFLKY